MAGHVDNSLYKKMRAYCMKIPTIQIQQQRSLSIQIG